MKLLVTGGAGFIGSGFIHYILRGHAGDRIICLDALTYAADLGNLPKEHGGRLTFVKGDITDKDTVESLFSSYAPDAVVNFAAQTHVDRSIRSTDEFLRTNVIGTQVLMDACLRHGTARFHQVSTDEVYGTLGFGEGDAPFTERSALRPSNPYAASKAAADLLAMSYHKTFGLPVTISRSSNNYGERQHPEKLIPLAISRALRGLPIPVYGSGENVRDWIYVTDHVRAIDMIIRGGRIGEVYNVGGGCERHNIDVVSHICEGLGAPKSLISHTDDRPGHDLRYAIDYSKIEAELGWYPETDFNEGMRKTLDWYSNNKSFLERNDQQ